MRRVGGARRPRRDRPARGDADADARSAGARTIRLTASSSPTSTSPAARPSRSTGSTRCSGVSCSPENAVKLQRALSLIDVRDLLAEGQRPNPDLPLARTTRSCPLRPGEYLARQYSGCDVRAARQPKTTSCSKKSRRGTSSPRLARSSSKPEARRPSMPVSRGAQHGERNRHLHVVRTARRSPVR